MKYCPVCGSTIGDEARVCPVCGANQPAPEPDPYAYQDSPQPTYRAPGEPDPTYAQQPPYAQQPYAQQPPYPQQPVYPQQPPYGQQPVYPQQPQPVKNDKGKLAVIIVMAVAIVALLGALIAILVFRGRDSRTEATTAAVTTAAASTTQVTIAAPTTQPTTAAPTTAAPTTQPTTAAPTAPPAYTPPITSDEYVVVNLNEAAGSGPILNVRGRPSYDSDVVAQIPNGSTVCRLAQQNGWSYIDYGAGRGWCDTEVAGFDRAQPSSGETVVVRLNTAAGSGTLLNIRSGPGYDYDVIDRIVNGSVVTRLKQENGWSYIDYGSGRGWCDTAVAGF